MSYKSLLPTFRTRQRWVLEGVDRAAAGGMIDEMLNVGCGEGDLDRALKQRCRKLVAVDINADDVEHARSINTDVDGLEYAVQDALHLTLKSDHFDVVVCLEVIEHVEDPRALVHELARVVKPGGTVIITCPSAEFPVTYDPINWALATKGKHLGFGAYGYGHSWLVRMDELEAWIAAAGLEIVHRDRLSKALAGLFECYWPGLLQRLLKPNARNRANQRRNALALRPAAGDTKLVALTDALVDLDARLFEQTKGSVGLAVQLRKPG
jgi:2-polyprenyl-3-methyl-5-hydroxy-6-metoxy-1,4-benzoquinol methylase